MTASLSLALCSAGQCACHLLHCIPCSAVLGCCKVPKHLVVHAQPEALTAVCLQVRLPGVPPFALPEALLQSAVASADQALAVDALQMACFQQKANVLPCAPADQALTKSAVF